jgi:hypothetical protein
VVSSTSPAADVVSPQVARLASRIVFDNWRPPEPVLSKVSSLAWGSKIVTASVGDARVAGDALELDWDAHAALAMVLHQGDHGDLHGEALVGQLTDGRSFTAEDGRISSSDKLVGRYWQVSTPGRNAQVWVTRIHGMGSPTPSSYGNLSVIRKPAPGNEQELQLFSPGHYRLCGAHTYYLVKASDEAWFLVIDTGSERAPERKEVFVDMLALQFVFGRAFHYSALVGLDGSDVVALLGGQHGRDHSHRPRIQPTVPLDFVDECWPAPFFERLSLAYRKRPELRFFIPLTFTSTRSSATASRPDISHSK